MARLLYGVMGDANGHVQRALSIARELKRHDFLFVGGGKVATLRRTGYPVVEIPMLATFYRQDRVDIGATVTNAVRVLAGAGATLRQIRTAIRQFRPHMAITDYEFFLPLAARSMGLRCVSIDHQHFLTQCAFPAGGGQALSRLLFYLPLRLLYQRADSYLVTSFFKLPMKPGSRGRLFPPVIKEAVQQARPVQGRHALVYQTAPTLKRLLPVLRQQPYRCVIYGLGQRPACGNLVFRAPSSQGFVQDLATCRFAITNGGHNVISEALFLGKPVFAIPIHLAYEQYCNALMLRRLGWGDFGCAQTLSPDMLQRFVKRLPAYRRRLVDHNFLGNRRLAACLEELLTPL